MLTQILAAFGTGLLSVLSPCVLPVVPLLVAGIYKEDKLRPLLIVIGLSITFVLMGVLSSLFGSFFVGRSQYFDFVAAGIIILLGFFFLFDINIFKKLNFISNKPMPTGGGKFSGLLTGMALGIIWIPCTGPFLSAILIMVATAGKLGSGILLLIIYSFGFSLPILAIAYFSHFFREKFSFMQKNPVVMRMISAGVLIFYGIYVLINGKFIFTAF